MNRQIDFIVIGGMKCGTTTLYDILSSDARIALPVNKEAPYFTKAEEMTQGYEQHLRKYYREVQGKVVGKITPHYMMWAETAAKNIAAASPESRIIAIIRDPIDRLISHYSMCVGMGIEARNINDAIADSLSLSSLNAEISPTNSYVACSEYGRMLDIYYSVLDPSNMLVLNFNQLVRDQEDLVRRVYEHIGLNVHATSGSGGRNSLRRGKRFSSYYRSVYYLTKILRHLVIPFVSDKTRYALRFKLVELRVEAFSPDHKKGDLSSDLLEKLRVHFEKDAKVLLSKGIHPYWLTDGRYLRGNE